MLKKGTIARGTRDTSQRPPPPFPPPPLPCGMAQASAAGPSGCGKSGPLKDMGRRVNRLYVAFNALSLKLGVFAFDLRMGTMS